MQERADSMALYPGYWSESVTGQVSSGEDYRDAAVREAEEELGVAVSPTEAGRFLSPKWRCKDGVDWEQIAVFETLVDDPKISLSDEPQDGRFIAAAEFRRLASADPAIFTPDALLSSKFCSRMK